jgi:MOSC domain-containing protein YiiM
VTIDVAAVCVGLPSVVGQWRGNPVTSGIVKRPITSETVEVGRLNLAGDQQADLRFHGGADKAVYAYPSEHLDPWGAELGQRLGAGAFGENLTTIGAVETDVAVGDVWSWGGAVLQVSQPRFPCYKLGILRGTQRVRAMLMANGRTGWYLRVLEAGTAPTAGPIDVLERHPAGVTVADVHRALVDAARPWDAGLLELEPLAEAYKRMLASRHGSD